MERERLVCWDIDGTLILGGGVTHEVFGAAFHAVTGRSPEMWPDMPGRTDKAIATDLLALHGVPTTELGTLLATLEQTAPLLRERLRVTGHALTGAREALDTLAAQDGVTQTVVTGNLRPLAEAKLATFGLATQLDLTLGAYGDHYTDRAQLVRHARQFAQRQHGAFPARSVSVIGDTPFDIRAARELGVRAIGVATGRFGAADLRLAGADAVLDDLSIPAAVVTAIFDGATT